jgi:hypothetical protein
MNRGRNRKQLLDLNGKVKKKKVKIYRVPDFFILQQQESGQKVRDIARKIGRTNNANEVFQCIAELKPRSTESKSCNTANP